MKGTTRRSLFHRFIAFLPLLPLFLAGGGVAAAEPAGDETDSLRGEIVIGATFPLTGEFEYYGQSAYYGANTRVKIINASGGINGKRLVLHWRDNRSDPFQAVQDVEELVKKYQVPAILGPLFSDSTMAVRSTVEKLKVVVMSPLASVDAATHSSTWIFRSGFTNTNIAKAMSNFEINSFGGKSCGIVYDPRHTSSLELGELFEKHFAEMGGAVVGRLPCFSPDGVADYATPLKTLAAAKPDFIFAASYALEAIEIVRAAKKENIAIRFRAPDTWDNELVFDASGTRLAGTAVVSSLFEESFNYRPFQIFFNAMEQAGMDNPDAQAASAYDAVSLLAIALAKGETAEDVRKNLLTIKRAPMATGRLSVNANGGVTKPLLIRIVERKGGRLIPMYAGRYDP